MPSSKAESMLHDICLIKESHADGGQCDEARPTCSGCADRKVECLYSTEVSKFIHLHQAKSGSSSESETAPTTTLTTRPKKRIVLNIRSSREPPQGNGLYHTFVPLKLSAKERARQAKRDAERRSSSISPSPPCSDVYRLASEFSSVLNSATKSGLRMLLFGTWLDMTVARIGTSLALDRSIACLITGHRAKFACDSRAMQMCRQRYGEALTALKDGVAGGTSCITAELIAATKMLMMFE